MNDKKKLVEDLLKHPVWKRSTLLSVMHGRLKDGLKAFEGSKKKHKAPRKRQSFLRKRYHLFLKILRAFLVFSKIDKVPTNGPVGSRHGYPLSRRGPWR